MALKICLDCGRRTPRSPCAACRSDRNRERDAQRGNFRERGYDSDFDKAKALLVPAAVSTPCPLCSTPMRAGAIDVDHIVPLASGGTNALTNLRATCSPCNRGRRT